MWRQTHLSPSIENRYGGKVIGDVVVAGSDWTEHTTLVDVRPGSVFDQAGLSDGDLVFGFHQIGEFYQALDQPQGTAITFEVAPGGNGPPLNQRPRRTVTIVAP
ncbi:MAG: hypothetical protein ACIAXF_03170 [Phycisphaerales bacterium JB063]